MAGRSLDGIGGQVMHERNPHLAHEVSELNESLGLAFKGVGLVANTLDVVEDESDLLEVGSSNDGGKAIDVNVPEVGEDGDGRAGVYLGQETSSGVLLEVTGEGGGTLPLGAILVGRAANERCGDPLIRNIRVQSSSSSDLSLAEAETGEPGLELLGSVDTLLAVGSTLIEVVAHEKRNVSELSSQKELRGLSGHEVTVNNSSERRGGDAERGSVVEDVVEGLPRKGTKTFEVVGGRVASSLFDKSIIVLLPIRRLIEQSNRATRLENSSTEEVAVLALVRDKLHTQGSSTGRLSPYSDLVGATSEGSDVVLKPSHSQTLILEAQVTSILLLHLFAEEEPPLRHTVVDGGSDNGLTLLDRLINDVAQVVPRVSGTAVGVALSYC